MTVKRALTLIFGLVLISIIAKELVWYMNPPSRLYRVGYEYDYTTINYVQFFVLFLIPSITAIFLYRADFKMINNFYDRAAGAVKKAFLAGVENKEMVLFIAVVMFWIFSLMEYAFFRNLIASEKPFLGPFDTYHEGEKIGFLYTFLNSDEALKDILVLHGYFLQVLTPYLAYLLAPENHAVMGFRLLFTMQTLLTWLGVIWIIWEIVNLTTEKENKVLFKLQFILFSIVFVASNGSFLTLDHQHAFLFLQLGLVFHFLRKLTRSDPTPRFVLILSFIIGVSIPLGLLYSTKYGVIFSVIFALAVFLLLFRKQYKLFLLGSSLGAISSGVITCLMLGWEQVLELGKMVLYWIEFYPPRFSAPFISDANEHYLWIPQLVIGILIVCGIQLVINFKQSRNFQSFIQENTHIIILLSLSILLLKVALDLSDKRHFRTISSPVLLLLFTLTTGWLDKLNDFRLLIVQSYTTHKTIWILVLIFLLFINTHPKEAFRHVKPYWKQISATDESLLAKQGYGYLTAVEEMRPEIQDMECFYTLTSENIWYYYFKKPSCSRYHILQYAIPREASYEIVDALRDKRPEVILFSNFRSNTALVTYHWTPEVYHFVYKNYRPYKLVGNHWFWKRSSGGVAGTQLAELDITGGITNPIYNNLEAFITLGGVLNLKNIYNIDAIYLTPARQETPLAIATLGGSMTRAKSGFLEASWSIKVPMVNVLPETKSFQLWGYSSSNRERIKIGGKFTLDHSKINIESNYVR
jgi:hypothetical protein